MSTREDKSRAGARSRIVSAVLLSLGVTLSGCKKAPPIFVKATAKTATVANYKDTEYARPASREIVTLKVDSLPLSPIRVTGVSLLSGKSEIPLFTDKAGHVEATLRFIDIPGPLVVDAVTFDKKGNATHATQTVPVEREPGLHVVYDDFEIVPGTCKGSIRQGKLTATGCPAGTVFTLNTATARSTGGPVSLAVDLDERLAALPVALDSKPPLLVPLTLKIQMPEGKTHTSAFEAAGFEGILRTRISAIPKGGFSLGASDVKGAKHGAVLVEGGNGYLPFGNATVVREIDLVAIEEPAGSRTSSCGTYTQKSTGKSTTFALTITDANVTLYDRRSGKKLTTRFFRGSGTCGEHVASANGGFSGGVSSEDVKRWVSGYLH